MVHLTPRCFRIYPVLCAIGLLIPAGCATVHHSDTKDKSFTIVGADYINIPPVQPEEIKTSDNKTGGWHITDLEVYNFAIRVKQYMDIRRDQKGVLRKASGSIQVASAAVAASLAALKASIEYVTGFAGFSAIIPQLQEIFQAREGGEAFRDGSQLIGKALAQYIGQTDRGIISDSELTGPGKNLYGHVMSALILVDKALQQLIPTQAELRAAVDEVFAKPAPTTLEAELAEAKQRLQDAEDASLTINALYDNNEKQFSAYQDEINRLSNQKKQAQNNLKSALKQRRTADDALAKAIKAGNAQAEQQAKSGLIEAQDAVTRSTANLAQISNRAATLTLLRQQAETSRTSLAAVKKKADERKQLAQAAVAAKEKEIKDEKDQIKSDTGMKPEAGAAKKTQSDT